MEMLLTLLFGALFLLILVFGIEAFIDYELNKNNTIYQIRNRWSHKNDPRYTEYTYNEMFYYKYTSWYNFRMPKDEDFPKKRNYE